LHDGDFLTIRITAISVLVETAQLLASEGKRDVAELNAKNVDRLKQLPSSNNKMDNNAIVCINGDRLSNDFIFYDA
jgi:hypothetical protein